MVWACAAKRRQWLGKEMCGVWSGECQAKLCERLWKRTMKWRLESARQNFGRDCGQTVRHINWTGRMPLIVIDGETDKGCLMTTIGVSRWMFLLVPALPGCPGQNPESCRMVVCVCVWEFLSVWYHREAILYSCYNSPLICVTGFE